MTSGASVPCVLCNTAALQSVFLGPAPSESGRKQQPHLRKAMSSSLTSVSSIRYLATACGSTWTSQVFEPHLKKQNDKPNSKFNPFKNQSFHFSDLGARISVACDMKSSVRREDVMCGSQQHSCDPSPLRLLPQARGVCQNWAVTAVHRYGVSCRSRILDGLRPTLFPVSSETAAGQLQD